MEPNNTNPVQAPMESAAPAVAKKSITAILVVIGLIILIVLGALYLWGDKILNKENKTAPVVTTETVVTQKKVAPKSDEVGALESDLSASGETNIDMTGLDTI